MASYLVELAEGQAGTLKANKMVVSAASAADAKAFCHSQYGGDGGDWSNATVTTLADVASNADDALVGWRFHISVTSPAGALVADVTFVGDADDDTIDTIGAELATLLNATASIANAAYVTATQVLTIASGAGGDDLGDHTVVVEVFPPIINDAGGERENEDVAIPGFIASGPVHEQTATDPLSVTFAADTLVRPTLYRRVLGKTV